MSQQVNSVAHDNGVSVSHRLTPDLAVFVVSIERAIERRAAITNQLKELNLEFSFVNGIDVSKHDVSGHPEFDFDAGRRRMRRDVLPAELACAHAHINCYRNFLASNAEYALILEDDAVFTPAFSEFIASRSYRGISLLTLNHHNTRIKGWTKRVLFGGVETAELANSPFMCVAYTIDRNSARFLLDRGLPVSGPPDWPADLTLIKARATFPYLVIHPTPASSGQSVIGIREKSGKRSWRDYFAPWYWRRLFLKLISKKVA